MAVRFDYFVFVSALGMETVNRMMLRDSLFYGDGTGISSRAIFLAPQCEYCPRRPGENEKGRLGKQASRNRPFFETSTVANGYKRSGEIHSDRTRSVLLQYSRQLRTCPMRMSSFRRGAITREKRSQECLKDHEDRHDPDGQDNPTERPKNFVAHVYVSAHRGYPITASSERPMRGGADFRSQNNCSLSVKRRPEKFWSSKPGNFLIVPRLPFFPLVASFVSTGRRHFNLKLRRKKLQFVPLVFGSRFGCHEDGFCPEISVASTFARLTEARSCHLITKARRPHRLVA